MSAVEAPELDSNGDPVLVRPEEMTNPDDWSQSDLDAWEQDMREAAEEDRAVSAFLDGQEARAEEMGERAQNAYDSYIYGD